jgi:3-isopropylmalate dehydratase small subunit
MLPINKHKGIVIPLDRSNVDTDAIIPKQFLNQLKSLVLVQTYLTNGDTLTMENLERYCV